MEPLTATDPRLVGVFRLRARLGQGGMGRVYFGYSPAGRAVAVKVVHPELARDSLFLHRFRHEVGAAQAVNGLYAAPVLAAGPYDDPPWLATAFVPGPSLAAVVAEHGPLPEPALWKLAGGLVEALRAVHARGLVHRDLKPANVLLAADGPRVIDFGIARALDGTELTAAGMVVGTPAYMSPEQAEGRPAGPESDVFSLGSLLTFAATGRTPFGHGEAPVMLYRVVHAPPVLDGITGRLRDVIAACLAKDPGDRPALSALADAIVAGGPPAGDAPASFWPLPMATLIREYEARLESGPPVGESLPAHPSGPLTHLPTEVAGLPLGRTRRRVLASLAGASLVGLGLTGWRLSQHHGPRAAPGQHIASHRRPTGPGTSIWAYRTGGPVVSGAAADNGIVYMGSSDHFVYAIEAATGRLAWKVRTGGAILGAVTVANGVVYVGSADGSVYALRAATGRLLWRHPTAGPVIGAPAVSLPYGAVIVGSADENVYALDASTGRRIWRHPTGGAVRSAPAVAGNTVYVGSDDRYLYALHAATGRESWRFGTQGPVTARALVLGPAYLCFGSEDGTLYQLDYTRQLIWTLPTGGAVGTPAIDQAGTLYAGSADASLYAVQETTGDQLWNVPIGGAVRSAPAADGNIVYAGSDDGYLYAINVGLATMRWKLRTGGPVRSAITAAYGAVFSGSLDHTIYAIRV